MKLTTHHLRAGAALLLAGVLLAGVMPLIS